MIGIFLRNKIIVTKNLGIHICMKCMKNFNLSTIDSEI